MSDEIGTYALDSDRVEEERRLIAQSRLLEAFSAETLTSAGLAPGMHVVELGTGAGDMAMLAARLVGPGGSVLGLERNPASVELARRRIAAEGLDNVTVLEADVASLGKILADRPRVDAIVGRLILMWTPERMEVLRACAEAPPGTVLWFFEPDMYYPYAIPGTPLWDLVTAWVRGMIDAVGAEQQMGPRFPEFFHAAGLPTPTLRAWLGTWTAADAPVWFWSNVIRGVLPLLEQTGTATAADVDIDTLEARLTAELSAAHATMFVPPMTAAWTRI
ncbi:MAG: methyltransferase domain-containing protein [Sporichthyaceae bacterium]